MKNGTGLKTASLFLVAAAALSTPLAAQQEVAIPQVMTTPHFFIAIIGGVILAIGFHILLTSLSVASGISLVGNVEKKSEAHDREKAAKRARELEKEPHEKHERVKATVETREPGRQEDEGRWRASADVFEGEEEEEGTSPMLKMSNAIGVWTVITASLSLFFASLLAVRLTLVGTVWMGITLGLIIWAAFFALMTYLELRSVSTLIGGVFTAALSGLRNSFSAVKGVFATSPEDRLAKVGAEAMGSLREELSEAFDPTQITSKLDEYVEKLRPDPVDFDRIKNDLTEILRNVQLEEHSEVTEGHLDKQTFVRLAMEQPRFKKEDKERVGKMYDEIRSSLQKEGRPSEKAGEVVDKLAGAKSEDAAQYRSKIEDYLRQTGREELDPDRIKEDIDKIFEDPKASREILLNRVQSIDRSTLVSILEQREDIDKEKAEKLVSNAEKGIEFVRQKVMGMSAGAQEAQEQAGGAARGKISQAMALPKKLEDNVRQYMSSIGRPEFDYDRLRLDFERMLHDPKASLKILRARLKLYDRDSLVALLSSRKDMSEEDADKLVRSFEQARENVLDRAERVESEVRNRIREAKRTAIHEAENVRQASAAAAWWMVGTAVVSGASAALGAVIAITW